jgi:hypothetical protein
VLTSSCATRLTIDRTAGELLGARASAPIRVCCKSCFGFCLHQTTNQPQQRLLLRPVAAAEKFADLNRRRLSPDDRFGSCSTRTRSVTGSRMSNHRSPFGLW